MGVLKNIYEILRLVITLFILPTLFTFLIVVQYNKVESQKSDWLNVAGELESFGVGKRQYVNTHGIKSVSDVFCLKLKNAERKFSWYERGSDYYDYVDEFSEGEVLMVFYEKDNNSNMSNIIRLERASGDVVFEETKFKKGEKVMLYLFLFFLIISILLPLFIVWKKFVKKT